MSSRIEEQIKQIQVESSASEIARMLFDEVTSYQSKIEADMDVAVLAASNVGPIIVHQIDYIGDTMIVFRGVDTYGNPSELIQHKTQLNFLLRSLKKDKPYSPQIEIGFH